jgi:hypothetical protein
VKVEIDVKPGADHPAYTAGEADQGRAFTVGVTEAIEREHVIGACVQDRKHELFWEKFFDHVNASLTRVETI